MTSRPCRCWITSPPGRGRSPSAKPCSRARCRPGLPTRITGISPTTRGCRPPRSRPSRRGSTRARPKATRAICQAGTGVRRRLAAGQARHRHRYRRGFRGHTRQDAYEHFIVPTNFKEGMWIRAAEIRPGNRRVVHHVHVNLVQDDEPTGPTSIEGMRQLCRFPAARRQADPHPRGRPGGGRRLRRRCARLCLT